MGGWGTVTRKASWQVSELTLQDDSQAQRTRQRGAEGIADAKARREDSRRPRAPSGTAVRQEGIVEAGSACQAAGCCWPARMGTSVALGVHHIPNSGQSLLGRDGESHLPPLSPAALALKPGQLGVAIILPCRFRGDHPVAGCGPYWCQALGRGLLPDEAQRAEDTGGLLGKARIGTGAGVGVTLVCTLNHLFPSPTRSSPTIPGSLRHRGV